MQRIQISRSSSPAVVPWLRQLVASNHVGAPRRTISLSNHSPHGHIAPPTNQASQRKAYSIEEEAPQGWAVSSKTLLSFLGRIMQSTFNLSTARARSSPDKFVHRSRSD